MLALHFTLVSNCDSTVFIIRIDFAGIGKADMIE